MFYHGTVVVYGQGRGLVPMNFVGTYSKPQKCVGRIGGAFLDLVSML